MAFSRKGYGQVEIQHAAFQRTGEVYASLKLDPTVEILQNGEFMYYDLADGMVTAVQTKGKVAEPYMVFNEVKLYEPQWRTSYKDFAMIKAGDNYVTSALATGSFGDGATQTGASIDEHTEYGYNMAGFAPRLVKINLGDIFTTNMVKTGVTYTEGDVLQPKLVTTTGAAGSYKTLQLEKVDTSTSMPAGLALQIIKVYTMPDGQDGLKLQRVQ